MTKYQMFLRWVFVAMITIGLLGVMAINALNPQKSLQGLDTNEIAYVAVQTPAMTDAALLPEERVEELLDILAHATLEKPVLSTKHTGTVYTFQKAGNVRLKVTDATPYLVVRGLAWEVDKTTQQALSTFYNSLIGAD